jgi:hypothetical protein
MTNVLRVLFPVGDCVAGALVGVVTTVAVRAVVSPGSDMVGAMMLGMVVGILVHVVVGMALSPLLGMFETMVPGMFIGMYGGMFFGMRDAMRDAMQPVPLATALAVGAAFGAAVTLGVLFWNVQLRDHTRSELADAADQELADFVVAAGRAQGRSK